MENEADDAEEKRRPEQRMSLVGSHLHLVRGLYRHGHGMQQVAHDLGWIDASRAMVGFDGQAMRQCRLGDSLDVIRLYSLQKIKRCLINVRIHHITSQLAELLFQLLLKILSSSFYF